MNESMNPTHAISQGRINSRLGKQQLDQLPMSMFCSTHQGCRTFLILNTSIIGTSFDNFTDDMNTSS